MTSHRINACVEGSGGTRAASPFCPQSSCQYAVRSVVAVLSTCHGQAHPGVVAAHDRHHSMGPARQGVFRECNGLLLHLIPRSSTREPVDDGLQGVLAWNQLWSTASVLISTCTFM